MKNIIFPTDFSENARHAAKYALNLFSNEALSFHLVHSFEPRHPTGMLIKIDDILKKEAKSSLKNERLLLQKEEFGQTEFTEDAVIGSLDNVLNQVIRKRTGDLIVMGTKGATGLKEIFIGSNASEIIQDSIKPVLAIPENAELKKPQNILLAADYENLDDVNVLAPLRELAMINNSKIMVVNITSNDEGEVHFNSSSKKLEIEEYFEEINHEYHHVTNDSVTEGLNDFIESNDIDMLAMIPEKNNFFNNLFHKSVTKLMVLHTKIPLLALRL